MTTYQVPRVRTPSLSAEALRGMADKNLRLWLRTCARLAQYPARREWAMSRSAAICAELRSRGYVHLLRILRGEP